MRQDAVGQRAGILELRPDDHRIRERGLGDLELARRAAHAVRRERLAPVGRVADLGVIQLVVVRRGHDGNPLCVREVRERLERRDDLLAAGDVQFPVRAHAVVQGVYVPEDQSGHVGSSHA